MSEQHEYQAPLVQPEKKLSEIWKAVKGSWEILKHGLVPHQKAQLPSKKFDSSHIAGDEEFLYQTALEMYKESTGRIDVLEEKGFKLLTYISAVSAILIYFLSKDITGFYKFCVITSLFMLVVAIIISLRCIGVKAQKVIFLDAMFFFNTDEIPKTKDKKAVVAEILNCAVFNQTVADNTADILRASRIMLSLGILTTIISCIFFLATPGLPEDQKVYHAKVQFADTAFTKSLLKTTSSQELVIKAIQDDLSKLKKQLDSTNTANNMKKHAKPSSRRPIGKR